MLTTLFAAVLLASPAGAGASASASTPAAAPAPAEPSRRMVGKLLLEGVPEVPDEVTDRIARYLEVRGAGFVGFEHGSDAMLITTRFGDASQIHRVAAPGAARTQLTFLKEPVSWAASDKARPGAGFLFRMDTGGAENHQYYWQAESTGQHLLLTDGKSRNQSAAMATAGGRFAFASNARNGKDFDLYIAPTGAGAGAPTGAGSAPQLVREFEGSWWPMDWSPDDKQLLVGNYISANESSIHLLDLASGELRRVCPTGDDPRVACESATFARVDKKVLYTSDEDSEFQRLRSFDPVTKAHAVLTPDVQWEVEDLAVSRDGKSLAWTLNEGGRSSVFLAQAGRTAAAKRIEFPLGVASGLAFDPSGTRLGLTLSSSSSSSDAWSVDTVSGKAQRWTFSEMGGIPESSFVTESLIEFKSFDGRMIPSWLHRPAGARAAKLPVIIAIHGGPESQARPRFSSLTQYWTNELGVAVLTPNVRGSSGYGKTWLQLDNGMLREDSVKDIGALLDWIKTQPDLDSTRVGVIGGSYGGYMVLASLITYGDRIRCGVDSVGISNFVTFLESTSEYRRDLRRAEYGDERDPAMRAHLMAISPTTNAARLRQPLLVAQGKNDPRVPLTEAEQVVRVARENGGTVWYVMAEDEGHGFAKRANRDVYNGAVSLFFETFLLAR